MRNVTMLTNEQTRISQSVIQSGNLSMSNETDTRINAMLNDYSFRISSLEDKVSHIENDVNSIKSNYLTEGAFFRTGGIALITLIVTAGVALWAVFANLDGKIGDLSNSTDQKLQLVEQRIQKVEDRINKLEIKTAKIEVKIDAIDQKIDELLARPHTKQASR